MRERWNRIRTGVWITVFSAMGALEYIQLMYSFDLPQVILLMPFIGALSYIVLQKPGFFVLIGTTLLSCLFQIFAGDANAVSQLSADTAGIAYVILYVLPICLIFEAVGMGAGVLIRVCINKRGRSASVVVCLVLGFFLVIGPYEVLYRNPLYPLQARLKLNQYVDETYTDYEISKRDIYFDLNMSSYRCRVIMADGRIRLANLEKNGTITDGT